MAAQPTVFEGETIKPAAHFSSAWETKLRPNFPPSKPIRVLKNLHRQTPLAHAGKPVCILVVPAGKYQDDAARVQTAIKKKTGVEIPVRTITTCTDPRGLMADTHVITFGNMSTNPFLFRLYCRWLTLLDLTWPGKNGHALLSLHDPFGDGYNAILAGGSDAAGVTASARILAEKILASPDGTLGWLHDIALGAGQTPPEPWKNDPVAYWSGTPGNIATLGTRSCFGWNSIATYAALYYMTGNPVYAEHFKRLAMSRPGHVPEEIRQDYSYWNPANPIVETYHYYSYLIPCLWDLIEEAPVFTDAERLFITNKLVEQQDHYDPDDTFATPNGSRHASYQMLNIYTGSRYLAKSYPERRWFQRLANIRAAFDAWKTSRTWGELDLVPWMPTSIEFVLNFFLLDDQAEAFTQCGGTAEMIAPQLLCWTGSPLENVNRQQALNMMHKAAWMLGDGSWVWLARQAPYDLTCFRIGQSWWPDARLAPVPPTRVLDRIERIPLQPTYWQRAGKTIPLDQGNQFVVYRNTLDEKGDYLRLDVAWFCDRNPYHLVTPDVLRLGGTRLIDGLGSLVTVRRQGLLETARSPQMAALTGAAADPKGAAMTFFTPNMSFSSWRRTVLHRTGFCTVFIDRLTARSDGPLEVEVDWNLMGAAGGSWKEGLGRVVSGTVDLACAGIDAVRTPEGNARLEATRNLRAGESMTTLSILAPRRRRSAALIPMPLRCCPGRSRPGSPSHVDGAHNVGGGSIRRPSHAPAISRNVMALALPPLAPNIYAYAGKACVFAGPGRVAEIGVQADGAYLDAETMLAAGVTAIEIGDWALRPDHPVTLVWDLASGMIHIGTTVDTTLDVNGKKTALQKGDTTMPLPPPATLNTALQTLLSGVAAEETVNVSRTVTEVELQGNAAWMRENGFSCLRFDTKADWGLLPGNVLPAASDFTIEAWIRPEHFITPKEAADTHVASQVIVAQWAVKNQGRSWMLLLTYDRLNFWISRDGRYETVAKTSHPLPLKPGWNHVAVVYAAGRATLLVNGKAGETVELGPVGETPTPVTLGRYLVGYPFTGRMSGVRLFDQALPLDVLASRAGSGPAQPVDSPIQPVVDLRPDGIPAPAGAGDWKAASSTRLPGQIRLLRVAPAALGGDVWVACDPRRLVLLDAAGKIRRTLPMPASVTALCPAPDRDTAEQVAVVVGLDNDDLLGIDRNGEILWQQKAEVHSRFWLDGHWRAPWFTDPKTCHGILDLRFIRWKKDAPADIALGRACTVELRALDGTLIERIPITWGDRAALGESRDKQGNPILTAANWYRSLGANMQAITRARKTTGSIYYKLPDHYTRIPGHGQGFLYPHLADLDGDGHEEFLTALCGSWNDIAVYDARRQNPRWVRVLGPWKRGAIPLLCGLDVGDIDGDGRQEVLAAARNGWAWLFNADGSLRWAVREESPAESSLLTGSTALVGRRDGSLSLYDAGGARITRADLEGAVTHLAAVDGTILAGTRHGILAILPLPP